MADESLYQKHQRTIAGITARLEEEIRRRGITLPENPEGEVVQLHPGSRACTPCLAENPEQYAAFPTLCPHRVWED